MKHEAIILDRLRAGKWRVDADAGLVYGMHGPVGSLHPSGYVAVTIQHRKKIRRAQIVWVATYGAVPDGLMLDHINRVRHDDRISNLRLVDAVGNRRNRQDNWQKWL